MPSKGGFQENMNGRVVGLGDLKEPFADHKWVRHLAEMGVTKFGAVDHTGSADDSLSKLLNSAPSQFAPFTYTLVSYLGFFERPLGLLFRSMEDKDFRIEDFGINKLLYYVTQSFELHKDKFKYGYPIVLLEGSLDAECFSYLTGYPYAMGYLKSYVNAWTAAFLSSMTNKFLLVPDNDQAGRETSERTLDNFKYYRVKVEVLKTAHKDFDDVYKYKDELEPKKALAKLRGM